ncbi:MAG: hypothetical protein CMB55_05365 [Euryarchaeota archaeon]|nr:hypothetical protein [Euryarchaeota archaeon]
MSGSLHDVKNDVWMRAVIVSVILLFVGGAAYGAFAVGVGSVKKTDWDAADEVLVEAKTNWNLLNETEAGGTSEEAADIHEQKKDARIAYDEAKEAEIDAHLSYLTWITAGKTLLVMMIIYAAFYGISGFYNSIQPEEEHDDHHGDDHEEHHGSASPIMMAAGLMLFMIGFPGFVNTCKSLLGLDYQAEMGDFGLSIVGAAITIIGIGNWWNEDLKGQHEQIASSDPFQGQDIRKAGMWVFLISETMVFASFFSSYLRMRTGWCTEWAVDAGKCEVVDTITASDLLRHEVGTLLPGAINTFALIISSYTIVLALKVAKDTEWKPSENALMAKMFPTRKKAVRNYLIITLALGSMFIVLKLVEWSHLIAEGFTIDTQAGSIFYVATGAHGLHVFIGLLVMLFMVFKADVLEDGYNEQNGQGIEYFGLYWHFVDLAWVAIFPAFYLY